LIKLLQEFTEFRFTLPLLSWRTYISTPIST